MRKKPASPVDLMRVSKKGDLPPNQKWSFVGGHLAGTDTGGEAVLVGGTQCPQPAATQKSFYKK